MKRQIKSVLAFCLVLSLCTMMIPAASVTPFSDVSTSHWAYTEIVDMEARGIVQGNDGKFYPGDPISKRAFLSMVCRIAGFDDRSLEVGSARFQPAIAYGRYFDWFQENDMDDSAEPIDREFAAQLLVNALFLQEIDGDDTIYFRDQEDITRRSYVQTAVKLGLMEGYNDGYFRPQGQLTRAAAAAILHRALMLKGKPVIGASVQVPVLMYHDVSYLGYGYSKTPEIFRAQLQELKKAGFQTVFYADIINYVEAGTPLPAKPIIISVDDGYRSNYEYIYPILQELNMKAEISIIGDAIQYANWGMSWDQIREMTASGLVSFQAHTKALHGDHSTSGGRLGVLKLAAESWDDYTTILGNDTEAILNLIETETGVFPQAFTYPRGKHNPLAEAVTARMGCKVSVTTKDGIAVVTQGDLNSLRLMDRIGMDFRNGSVVSVLRQFGYQS